MGRPGPVCLTSWLPGGVPAAGSRLHPLRHAGTSACANRLHALPGKARKSALSLASCSPLMPLSLQDGLLALSAALPLGFSHSPPPRPFCLLPSPRRGTLALARILALPHPTPSFCFQFLLVFPFFPFPFPPFSSLPFLSSSFSSFPLASVLRGPPALLSTVPPHRFHPESPVRLSPSPGR